MPRPLVEVDTTDLRRALREIGDRGLTDEMKAANKSAAELVVHAALPHVPVRTGRLKRTVKALGSQKLGQVKAGTAAIDYAAAIHWGRLVGNVWGGKKAPNQIKGRPFLWDAAQAARRGVIREYEQAVERLLDKVRGR